MSQPGVTATEQYIQNSSFDPDFGVLVVQPMGYDGQNLQRPIAESIAIKVTESGAVTYVATAAPGTAQSTAKWQAKKIDETSGLVITFADGNGNYDNVATDLTALSYS